jgi:histidinol-phosphate aminotransferase
VAPGLNAITSERSFIVYPIVVKAQGGQFITVPMRGDSFNLEAILRTIDPDTRIVFIANPNNPTGSLLPPEELDRFMDRVPAHVCVVLDEAYSDFAEYFARQRGVEYSHSLDYVRGGKNIVVLRTFSKAHGLAGVRLGYGIAPAEAMSYFARLKTVFSVSGMAEAAGLAAMDDEQHIRKTLENNAAGVDYLSKKIADLGFRVAPTWANFLYVEVGEDAGAFGKRMQDEGVILRPLTGNWGAPHAIRITVGTPEQNRKCVAALKKVTEKVAVGSR